MPVTARQLVGREDELGAIVGLLDAADQLPRTAVLAGEAGIGKTSLWLAGIDCAAGCGYRVLSSRPSEAETGLSFAGLTDLLGDEVGAVLPRLPPIQRRALEAALLLGESTHADERAVAAAFLRAIGLLADDGPLCLAVDDVQWLDAASVAALRFALTRLNREPIAVLLAVRGDLPIWLRRSVPEERLRTVEVEGLSLGAIHELLRTRFDVTLPRPTLIRLWETSAGNPFFALELATALQRRGGALDVGEGLPIPSDLDELLRERLAGLGAAALEVAHRTTTRSRLADGLDPHLRTLGCRRVHSRRPNRRTLRSDCYPATRRDVANRRRLDQQRSLDRSATAQRRQRMARSLRTRLHADHPRRGNTPA